MFRGRRMAALDIYFAGSVAGQGMAGFGATLSFPRVRVRVPLPSDLPTFVIVHLPTVYPGIEPKRRSVQRFPRLETTLSYSPEKSCPVLPLREPRCEDVQAT